MYFTFIQHRYKHNRKLNEHKIYELSIILYRYTFAEDFMYFIVFYEISFALTIENDKILKL